MSELDNRWFWAYPTESVDCDGITGSSNEVYSKSEADAVIAEKDKEMVNNQNERLIKTILHHKHKRCLAMAKLCNAKWLVHNFAEIPVKLRFYDKWEKRWLELAEKFKEAK